MRSLFVWKMSTPSPTGKGKRLQRKQGHQHRNTNEQHEHYEGVTLPKIYSIENFKKIKRTGERGGIRSLPEIQNNIIMIILSVQKHKERHFSWQGKKTIYRPKTWIFCMKIDFVSLSAMHVNLSLAVEMTILSVLIVKRFKKV